MAATIDYSARELQLIMEQIKANLRSDLADVGVNDFFVSNEGFFILAQISGVAEMNGYTLDRTAAECFVDTVETRPNMVSLLKLIGFQLRNPTPERVIATLRRTEDPASPRTVDQYTKILAKNASAWSTEQAITFDSGVTQVTVGALQGDWSPVSYTSNGAPFQMLTLSSQNVADGMIRVAVEGVDWQLARNNTFVGHGPDDTVFRVTNTADQRTRVEFGNGGEGLIPPRGSAVLINALVTLGPNGKIGEHQLANVGVTGTSIVPDNDQPSAGGKDFETLSSAKRRYPAAFIAMRRAVTREDFEALALLVPGVMQAKAVDRNIDSRIGFFRIKLYVLGFGGVASDALNTTVNDYLVPRADAADLFDVVSPTPIDVDVAANLHVKRSYPTDDVQSSVVSAVQDFFTMTDEDTSQIQLGADMPFSQLVAAMQAVPGVAYLDPKTPLSNVTVGTFQYARLRSVNITVVGTV